MDLGLTDRVVLVTGGAGAIGTATCRLFASEGARVAVHYHRSRAAAVALAAEVGGTFHGADLRNEGDVEALFSLVRAQHGRVDVCVANAGHYPTEEAGLHELSATRWEQTLGDNLRSVFLTARAFLREVAGRGKGNLVMVSSNSGHIGEPGRADYAAAKAAITHGLLPSLKNEIFHLAPEGRVNVVAPARTVAGASTRDAWNPSVATTAMRKLGRPDDVAHAVVWLASDTAAGHVNGAVVAVNGGMEGRLLHPPP